MSDILPYGFRDYRRSMRTAHSKKRSALTSYRCWRERLKKRAKRAAARKKNIGFASWKEQNLQINRQHVNCNGPPPALTWTLQGRDIRNTSLEQVPHYRARQEVYGQSSLSPGNVTPQSLKRKHCTGDSVGSDSLNKRTRRSDREELRDP